MKPLLIIGYILLAIESVFLFNLYRDTSSKIRVDEALYKACTAQLMWMEIKHNEPLDY